MATILVTDDDRECRETIRKTLEREGHTLESAADVDGAIRAVKRRQFDLIVCDYRMPGKTGLDLMLELEGIGSHVPVLLVSAYADLQTEAAAKHLGVVALLKKPFRRRQLLDYAARALHEEVGMPFITHILVPVDFSDASRKAMHYAAVLALKFQSRLTAAHIVPSFGAFNYAFPGDSFEFEKKVFAEAAKQLPNEIPHQYRDRLKTETVIKAGDVRDELLVTIQNEKADLVVMGTHGRRSIERFLLGSTTEDVLRRVPVPILTVSHRGSGKQAESPFDAAINRIVYATDLSETNASGLHYSAELARALGAHLTMLHVMDLRDTVAFNEADVHASLMGRLHKAVGKERCEGLQIGTDVVRGVPYREILKYAEKSNADLIVINLQSKGLLERAVLGSTAERVIRAAPIPVLSIPGLGS